jgi:hypothetical protein
MKQEGETMKLHRRTMTALLMASSLSAAAFDRAQAASVRHAGVVLSVDQAAGTIVVGDMGPKLPSGESKITKYTMRVTPETELLRATRTAGVAPSGWPGDYVETRLTGLDVKPGDWVTATAEVAKRSLTAIKIVVVDTTEP